MQGQASEGKCDLPAMLHPLSKRNPACLQHSLFTDASSMLETLYSHSFIARPFLTQTQKIIIGQNTAIASKNDLFQLSSWSQASFSLQESPSRDSHKARDPQVKATFTWFPGCSLGRYHFYQMIVSAKPRILTVSLPLLQLLVRSPLVLTSFKTEISCLIEFLYFCKGSSCLLQQTAVACLCC